MNNLSYIHSHPHLQHSRCFTPLLGWLTGTWPLADSLKSSFTLTINRPKPWLCPDQYLDRNFYYFKPSPLKTDTAQPGPGVLTSSNMISSYLKLFSVKLVLSRKFNLYQLQMYMKIGFLKMSIIFNLKFNSKIIHFKVMKSINSNFKFKTLSELPMMV